MFEILATKNDAGRTLFKLLSKYLNNISKSKLEKIFRKRDIKVNNLRISDKSLKINQGDKIVVYGVYDAQKDVEIPKINVNLDILYEDQNILIVDKKNNIPVHGKNDSLDNVVLTYLKYTKVDSFKPSHVGRLDKETSGLIVYAKNYKTLVELNANTAYFKKKYIFKSDLILLENSRLDIEIYLYKDELNRKMKFSKEKVPNAKLARTLFYLDKKDKIAELLTGRKHQIRATLSYLKKPIYGDKKYGGKKEKRLMLHAFYIQFNNLKDELKYLNKQEFWTKKPKW
ncbi:pseudouridine synthase [Mycoplasmopsis cynos]|uniref:pseudouridine synthase n=1 Tax=Mycoplasmopsis cynos TaxID=171284 RepID=UPI00253FDAD5|nr:RluA family pseudouridine synthase [Mycoplasmopsis cynos]MCU9934880.1 RluA family pseudouridine synthase [Mycoplasmopsis cynos]